MNHVINDPLSTADAQIGDKKQLRVDSSLEGRGQRGLTRACQKTAFTRWNEQ